MTVQREVRQQQLHFWTWNLQQTPVDAMEQD